MSLLLYFISVFFDVRNMTNKNKVCSFLLCQDNVAHFSETTICTLCNAAIMNQNLHLQKSAILTICLCGSVGYRRGIGSIWKMQIHF